jgi:hypothetical protein
MPSQRFFEKKRGPKKNFACGGKGFLARRLGDGNDLIITIFQVFTEYAAGSFSQTQISKLRSNNQCYNTEILTQVNGHLDGSGGLYLKVARPHKQQQRPGK